MKKEEIVVIINNKVVYFCLNCKLLSKLTVLLLSSILFCNDSNCLGCERKVHITVHVKNQQESLDGVETYSSAENKRGGENSSCDRIKRL